MGKDKVRILVVLLVVIAIAVIYANGWHQYLSFDFIKSKQADFNSFYQENMVTTIVIFMAIYITSTALSIPGAAVLTLLGGGLFGLFAGTIIVSFASTIGATLAFLVSRFLLRESVQKKFGRQLKSINNGIAKDGSFYLFTLRLIPVVPFFVINLAMGLVPFSALRFFLVSQIGMLPGTIVYVNAGTQLSQLESAAGIMTPGILGSFALLGIFPFIAKFLGQQLAPEIKYFFARRKAFAGIKKPSKFDYNIVVIGAGSAGLVTSYIAAAVKAKVALIEKHKMGGDCLNTGCVPSKALIHTGKILAYARDSQRYGITKMTAEVNFAEVMDRVHRVIKKIEPHDSVERYTKLGVECIQGTGTIKSPFEVEVNGKILTTKNIVVAAGGEPLVPPFEGLDQVNYRTTDDLWEIREQPKRMVILGGGPIGSEMAQAFCRLGTHVTQVEMAPGILTKEDPDVAEIITKRFKEEGIQLLTAHKAKKFERRGSQDVLITEAPGGGTVEVEFDLCLLALGRKARVTGYGLENVGIKLDERRTIAVDNYLATSMPNIYVCGDAISPYQFTHTAAHEAWFCAVNSLFWPLKRFPVDYRVVPWVTYTDPEVARVGLNETEAKAMDIDHEVTIYGLDDLDRAIAEDEDHGFVKVITPPGKDKILGATIVGHYAGELITEFVAAMKGGYGLNRILGTIHSYPTFSEANKYAAGVWKQNHKPEKVLAWLQKYHAWRRG